MTLPVGALTLAIMIIAPASARPAVDASGAPPAPLHVHFQAGAAVGLAAREDYDEAGTSPVMLSWELAGLRWNGRDAAWGLGVRSAVDGYGFRVGPKVLRRLPLGTSGKAYAQFSGTWYLLSGSGDLDRQPGWALEAEVAPSSTLAFALGVESLAWHTYDLEEAYNPTGGSLWAPRTSNVPYAGVKFSQWTGVAMTAILFAAAIATYASSEPAGW
ncbi:MAG TPA: hypothetical protein PLQ13_00720 [Candidatus Krumholzibacteria bacterium]|nr:hypothetical protein [Candidatus Krumholzibacteria bacterium]